MDEKQLDEWTIMMASGLDPLTAMAATDSDDDPPPPQKKYPAWLAILIGTLIGFLIAIAVS